MDWYVVKRIKSVFADKENSETRFEIPLCYLKYSTHFFNIIELEQYLFKTNIGYNFLLVMLKQNQLIDLTSLVTITGRKELGNWNRDIINMTFLNPEEMKRLYAEMKESLASKKTNDVGKTCF